MIILARYCKFDHGSRFSSDLSALSTPDSSPHGLCLLLTLPPTVRKQSRPQPADLKLNISAVQRSCYRISFLSSQSTTDLLSLLLVYLFLLFDVPLIVQLAQHPSCARSSSPSLLFSPRLINFANSFLPMNDCDRRYLSIYTF